MTKERFAILLAQRIGEILPDGIRAWATGEYVYVGSGEFWSGCSVFLVEETEPFGRPGVVTAVENVLSNVQDYVSHDTTEPWPEGMPLPNARLDGDVVMMGYGSVERPVLALRPISMSGEALSPFRP